MFGHCPALCAGLFSIPGATALLKETQLLAWSRHVVWRAVALAIIAVASDSRIVRKCAVN
jgi:hypothetical protein